MTSINNSFQISKALILLISKNRLQIKEIFHLIQKINQEKQILLNQGKWLGHHLVLRRYIHQELNRKTIHPPIYNNSSNSTLLFLMSVHNSTPKFNNNCNNSKIHHKVFNPNQWQCRNFLLLNSSSRDPTRSVRLMFLLIKMNLFWWRSCVIMKKLKINNRN